MLKNAAQTWIYLLFSFIFFIFIWNDHWNEKQYALQIDCLHKHGTKKKQPDPIEVFQVQRYENNKDTSTFRTHVMFLKSNGARKRNYY